ncbi:MAG: DUF2628 domain-containing protein [Oscillospiraceae bacterium]|nr:DUF2628 domain-containing protein [Oscillospiraceae bacterium]
MFDYTGYECKSCKKKFEENDDIVVCPDCGTPYHRECWKQNGKCINDELHESGKSWKADIEEKVESGEIARCKCCGNSLNPKQLFCDRCGAPTAYYFSTNELPPPNPGQTFQSGQTGQYGSSQYGRPPGYGQQFSEELHPYMINFSDPLCGFNPDEEYEDGVTTRDLGEFIGSNTHYYLPKFKLMKTGHFKMSLNFIALFFPEFYFANRKMPLAAVLALVIKTLLGLPSVAVALQTYLSDRRFYEMFVTSFPALTEQFKQFMEINLNTGMFNTLYNITSIFSSIFAVGLGLFANYIYYRHAVKKAAEIKKLSPQSPSELLREKGGTSIAMTLVFMALYFASSVISIYGILAIFLW